MDATKSSIPDVSFWAPDTDCDMEFRLETGQDGTPVLHAISEGKPWNGWRTPIVTAGSLRSFVRRWQDDDPNGVWGEVIVDRDTLTLSVTRTDDSEGDSWSPVGHVDGEPVYMLDGWVWVHVTDWAS